MTEPLHVRTRPGTDAAAPVLVLLHGFPLDHRMWDDVLAVLPDSFTVAVPDLPGLGRSPLGTAGDASLEAAADAVAASLSEVLDKAPGEAPSEVPDETHAGTGRRGAVVVGLSMGGYVALALAERHPTLVAGLGLVDTKSTADDDAPRANRLRVAAEVEASGTVEAVGAMATSVLGESNQRDRPDLVARLAGWIGEQSPAGVAWSQRAMAARPDRTAVLAAFDGPVAVLVGEQDSMTPVAAAEHLAAAASGSVLTVVPGVGHLSAIEDPRAVAAAIGALVDRVVAQG